MTSKVVTTLSSPFYFNERDFVSNTKNTIYYIDVYYKSSCKNDGKWKPCDKINVYKYTLIPVDGKNDKFEMVIQFAPHNDKKDMRKIFNRSSIVLGKARGDCVGLLMERDRKIFEHEKLRRLNKDKPKSINCFDEINEKWYKLQVKKVDGGKEKLIMEKIRPDVLNHTFNIPDVQSKLKLESKRMKSKKSPVKKNSLTKSCKKMSGNIGVLGKNFNKLI